MENEKVELKDLQITDSEVIYQPPTPDPITNDIRSYYETNLEELNRAKNEIVEAQKIVDRLQPIIDALQPKYDALFEVKGGEVIKDPGVVVESSEQVNP